MRIPVVDIAPFHAGGVRARLEVARQWRDALDAVGFVNIAGHGIAGDVIDDTYSAARAFFDLPSRDKMIARLSDLRGRVRGYIPPLTENVGKSMGADVPADICESFVVPNPVHDDEWPMAWPDTPPGFRETAIRYAASAYALGRTLMRISALALELPENFFDPHYARMAHTLRLVEYPDQRDEPLPGQLRSAPHTDFGGFTILRQDDAPGGLQVLAPDGAWVDVPPLPGTLTINTGDLIQRWTNDRWRSNIHRVINPPRALTGCSRRLSIVFFTSPDDASEIACLPSCATADNPAKYPPVSAEAHILAKIGQTYTDHPAA